MDVDTAILRIKRQFGDEYDVIFNDDDTYGWIHEAELDIIRNTGCNDVTTTHTVASFPLAVPTKVNIKRVSIAGVALKYTSKDEIDLLSSSDALTGGVSYWYWENGSIYLWPTGSTPTATSVKVLYSKVPAIMEGLPSAQLFTVPEVYHDDIIKYCTARAHNKNRNFTAEKNEMDMYDRNIGNRARETQAQDVIHYKQGDPLDFVDYI